MPSNCCVPQCNSVSNKNKDLKFHQFPKSPGLKKRWIISIQSGKIPSKYAKVCSRHFREDDYDITSMGEWKMLKPTSIPTENLPKRTHDKSAESGSRRSLLRTRRDSTVNSTCAATETTESTADVINNMDNTAVPLEVCSVHVQTVLTLSRSQLISFSFLSNAQLKHFTGFNKPEFEAILYFFKTSPHHNCVLSMEDEILLTLMKFRQNYFYKSLQMMFDIDERVVTRIITFWTNHIYKELKSVDFWSTKCKRCDLEYDVVIDCTEMIIEKSKDPIVQQATYSQYKSNNTFKVLIGCTEYGAVIFVSDIYGGCTSDRVITEQSGLLDILKPGEYVLADRGFDISDLLEEKGIHLNIPPFKRNSQLSEEDVVKTRAIANRRIIIERVIGLAKKHRILAERLPAHIWPLTNKIVYICFMLTAFRNGII